MFKEEIKQKINANNKIIEEYCSQFIINSEVQKALQENAYLRLICEHELDEHGVCIYCGGSAV